MGVPAWVIGRLRIWLNLALAFSSFYFGRLFRCVLAFIGYFCHFDSTHFFGVAVFSDLGHFDLIRLRFCVKGRDFRDLPAFTFDLDFEKTIG